MRKTPIHTGEYYHICNRGNRKKPIFFNHSDYTRFLFLILFFQSPITFPKINRHLAKNKQNGKSLALDIEIVDKDIREAIVKNRFVELANFSFMPNHFHLTVKATEDNGIERYMHRILTSYTNSINTKYQLAGHVFQGSFKNIHIPSNEQLLYLSAYIHRNARELREWHNNEVNYPWSSYQDYVHKNRWGALLSRNIITEQFDDGKDYLKFCENTNAKSFESLENS